MSLLILKHEKYFRFCLLSLPARAQSEDANWLAIVYFCLQGLDLLNRLHISDQEKLSYAQSILRQKVEIEGGQGFRASRSTSGAGSYDFPSLSATCFALLNLLTLGHDYTKNIGRHEVMKFVSSLQQKTGKNAGAFQSVLTLDGRPFGENDHRNCYMALLIRALLKYDQLPKNERKYDIDLELMKTFVLARFSLVGGASAEPMGEPHSGLTFCALATLKLLDYNLNGWTDPTIDWLVHRQVDYSQGLHDMSYEYFEEDELGGFNGRDNKFADTCYAWWVTASANIINPQHLNLFDLEKSTHFLLSKAQNGLMGGFSKDGDLPPDPYHTFFALASLSLWGQLKPIDTTFVITQTCKDFLNTLWN